MKIAMHFLENWFYNKNIQSSVTTWNKQILDDDTITKAQSS